MCSECGYALHRTSTHTSKQRFYYYRCYGSDGYRHANGKKCTCRPIRQDYLDELVWQNVLELLEQPALIQNEIDQRIQNAKNVNPVLNQKALLIKQKAKLTEAMDKLLDAYKEGLVPIVELRKRMPELQKRINTTDKEFENLKAYELTLDNRLQLLDLQSFTRQLHKNLDQLNVNDKRKILKLLVKEIQVGNEYVNIKHSIPLKVQKNNNQEKSLQLCTCRYSTTSAKYIKPRP